MCDFASNINIYIGQAIRRERRKNNMSMNELAAKIGISQQQMSRYELGTVKITVVFLLQLSVIFNIPAAHFLEEDFLHIDKLDNFIIYSMNK